MLSTSGIVTVFAGTAGTPGNSAYDVYHSSSSGNGDGSAAISAKFYSTPCSLWMDISGNLFISDYGNDVIRIVSAVTKIISVYAGMSMTSFIHLFLSSRPFSYSSCIHAYPLMYLYFPSHRIL